MIVKIGNVPVAVPLQPKKETQKTTKKGAFSIGKEAAQEVTSASPTQGTEGAQKTSHLSGLMNLQEIEDGSAEALHARGEALLSHLDTLRQGLLLGTFSREDLEAIRTDLAQKRKQPTALPAKEVLELIEQRVHIELTKIEMSQW